MPTSTPTTICAFTAGAMAKPASNVVAASRVLSLRI
jgi:hypothetical protein